MRLDAFRPAAKRDIVVRMNNLRRCAWRSTILLAVVLAGCATTPAGAPETSTDAQPTSEPVLMPAPPWRIVYADGSANQFLFWQDTATQAASFEYAPVSPEQSSSGLYSGGEPASGVLTDVQVQALWQRVEALGVNDTDHVELRGKGTGQFDVTMIGTTRTFILARGDSLSDFDAFVAPFRVPQD